MPVAAAIGLFGLAHILFYLEALGALSLEDASRRLGLAVVGCLITLIGGRIVPSFTRNWLRQRDQEGGVSATLGFIDKLKGSEALVSYAAWLEAGRGLMQLVNVIEGDPLTAKPTE